jgi:hydroxymethylbilane synthase
MNALRLGTRPSALAIRQAEQVAAALRAAGESVQLVTITTLGDLRAEVPLTELGTPAAFTHELDVALLAHRVDLAVHSLKDLPTELTPGLRIAAIGARADPRDVLVSKRPGGLAGLDPGAVVATCSPRRRAQLLRIRPDLMVAPLRGNVESRVGRLDATREWSAILLAAAGLERLGLASRIDHRLDPSEMLPAPGQGAIAVTARVRDGGLASRIRRAFHDGPTARCVVAERALLGRLDAACLYPVAALAVSRGPVLTVRGRVLSPDGDRLVDDVIQDAAPTEPDAERLGQALAELLLDRGAGRLLESCAYGPERRVGDLLTGRRAGRDPA